MSRSLEDLRPEIRPMVDSFLADCAAADIDLLVTCTLRSNQDQAVIYAQGRTAPGKVVTNARPGHSAHNYGLGIDVVPCLHGKPVWDEFHPIWQTVGNFGQARGLQWFGAPESQFHEMAHFQHADWRTLATPTGVPE